LYKRLHNYSGMV